LGLGDTRKKLEVTYTLIETILFHKAPYSYVDLAATIARWLLYLSDRIFVYRLHCSVQIPEHMCAIESERRSCHYSLWICFFYRCWRVPPLAFTFGYTPNRYRLGNEIDKDVSRLSFYGHLGSMACRLLSGFGNLKRSLQGS
jgi:hypothetical protein